jgi:hypothetical protein
MDKYRSSAGPLSIAFLERRAFKRNRLNDQHSLKARNLEYVLFQSEQDIFQRVRGLYSQPREQAAFGRAESLRCGAGPANACANRWIE